MIEAAETKPKDILLSDLESLHGVAMHKLFKIRQNHRKAGKSIGYYVERRVYVTPEEADFLVSRLGKAGGDQRGKNRGNHA